MGASRYSWLVFAALLVPCVTVQADTVWRIGVPSPVYGIVDSSDDQSIVFKQTSDGTTFETITIARKTVSSIVVNYDSQRLSSLVHGDWQSWHDYAEELFSQKQDPVARNVAMRLLVVIAGNSKNGRQRNAALNELVELAQNDQQREGLQTLRYLETGKKQPAKDSKKPQAQPGSNARESAARLVQSIRRGENVGQQLFDPKIKETVSEFSHLCAWPELVQMAQSNRKIEDQGLRRLVALEYELRGSNGNAKVKGDGGSWHVQASRVSSEAFTLPTIKSVTGLDPQASRFVDGQWQK